MITQEHTPSTYCALSTHCTYACPSASGASYLPLALLRPPLAPVPPEHARLGHRRHKLQDRLSKGEALLTHYP
jgi:hypothetical protein